MTTAIKFIPPRVPLTDYRTGLISREWFLFFQGVFERIGGAEGPSTTDVAASLFEDAGSSETNAMLFQLEYDVKQDPASLGAPAESLDQAPKYEAYLIETLTTEVNELRELVAAMSKDIEGLKQSVSL
jgi:hypothetical protein